MLFPLTFPLMILGAVWIHRHLEFKEEKIKQTAIEEWENEGGFVLDKEDE
jgi:hypothetical protein